MGLGTFLLRATLYGGIATGAAYYPIYNSGLSEGQLQGFKKGYVVCEQQKNSQIEAIVKTSVDGFSSIYANAKSKVEELKDAVDSSKKSGLEGVTDAQIKALLKEKKDANNLDAGSPKKIEAIFRR